MSNHLINLSDLNIAQLKSFIEQLGEKPYRVNQIIQWIHQKGIIDFDQMSNLSKHLRENLKAKTYLYFPKIIKEQISIDGTIKWLLALEDGEQIETVYIPATKKFSGNNIDRPEHFRSKGEGYIPEKTRGTLCISSQVGCPLACTFCATGSMGFKRNLQLSEIVGQVWMAINQLTPNHFKEHKKITNVVLMGMGEPLLNADNVINAVNLLMNDHAYSISKRRVTLSTIGLIEPLKKLKQKIDCALAISLHAPTDKLRHQLMPGTKNYLLKDLVQVCKDYFFKTNKRKITFEYLLLRNINDQPEHAKALVKLLSNVPSKINLIIFNSFEKSLYRPPTINVVEQFQKVLIAAGINTRLRKSRGQDIAAACGQLRRQH